MLRNRVLYSPAVIKRFSEQILLEAQAIREEMHAARRELARLQALDAAQRAERDLFAPLH